MPKTKAPEPQRGDKCRFIKGVYKGMTGWIDNSYPKDSAAISIRVIINRDQDPSEDKDPHNRACVRKTSTIMDTGEPTTLHGIVLQDVKVAEALAELGRVIAMCGVEVADTKLIQDIVEGSLSIIVLQCALHQDKGEKARYSRTALKVYQLKKSVAKKRRGMLLL